ncbi:MAG: glycosyltransferase family 2 protein, partial [Cyanobacteria bacterium P01_D01_bin.128]
TPIQVAVARDAFIRSGGWDITMTSCDDIDSWIRVAQFGDALFINQCLAYRTVWTGGYDQKITLRRRLDTNALIKARIYQKISDRHRDRLPKLADVEDYLYLHWGLVALKQKQLGAALSFMVPAAFSPKAWQLLQQARRLRSQPAAAAPIEKIALA